MILNGLVGFSVTVACLYSVYTMAQNAGLTFRQLLQHWSWAALMQCAVVIISFGICMLLAIALDVLHAQMSWFTRTSMVIGIYICPLYASIGLMSELYVNPKRNVSNAETISISKFFFKMCVLDAFHDLEVKRSFNQKLSIAASIT